MSPPPLPTAPRKNRGCLIAAAAIGGLFILLFAGGMIAGTLMQRNARKAYPAQKQQIIQRIDSAGTAGDTKSLDDLSAAYGSTFEDPDFQSAMQRARARIAETKAKADSAKASAALKEKIEREAKAANDAAVAQAISEKQKEEQASTDAESKAKRDKQIAIAQQKMPVLIKKHFRGQNPVFHVTPYADTRDKIAVVVDCTYTKDATLDEVAKLFRDSIVSFCSEYLPKTPEVGCAIFSYIAPTSDGKGNQRANLLLTCLIRDEMIAQVNWRNPEGITIRSAFLTAYCYTGFEEAWNRQ